MNQVFHCAGISRLLVQSSLIYKTSSNLFQDIEDLLNVGGRADCDLFKYLVSNLEWKSQSSDSESVSTPASATSSTLGKKDGETVGWACEVPEAKLLQLLDYLRKSLPSPAFEYGLSEALVANCKNYSSPWIKEVLQLLRLSDTLEVCTLLQLRLVQSDLLPEVTSLLQEKFPIFIQNYIDRSDKEESTKLCPETAHLLCFSLLGGDALFSRDKDGEQSPSSHVSSEQRNKFLSILKQEFPLDSVPLILKPVLYKSTDCSFKSQLTEQSNNSMAKNLLDGSLEEFVKEVGYSFTSSVEECRQNIMRFGTAGFTSPAIAKVFGLMIKTASGLETEQIGLQNLADPANIFNDKDNKKHTTSDRSQGSWDVEVFIKALHSVLPSLQPDEVFLYFQHKGFTVRDRPALELLVKILDLLLTTYGSRLSDFKACFFLSPWSHREEQLLLLQTILANLDVFYILDYDNKETNVDCFKLVPDMEKRDIAVWKSVELVGTVCHLAEHFEQQIRELLKKPMSLCPDLLAYSFLQTQLLNSKFQESIVQELLPIFFGNHSNSVIILHTCWNPKHNREQWQGVLMQAMIDWYMMAENDQQSLSRILDLAQDLKALFNLLNSQSFPFIIDLACLACRREFLKLDKWLNDKIITHGEPFVMALIKFLHQRVPQLNGGKEDLLPKAAHLPRETVTSIMSQILMASDMSKDTRLTITQLVTLYSENMPQMGVGARPNLGLANLSDIPPTSSLANLTIGPPTANNSMFTSLLPSTSSINILGDLTQPPEAPGSPLIQSGTTPGVSSQSQLAPMFPSYIGSQNALPSNSLPAISSAGATILQQSMTQAHRNTVPAPVDIQQIFGSNLTVNQDVEDEVNTYFQRIYNTPPRPVLSVEEVLRMLKKFHTSEVQREKELYSFMLKNLYEEYKFYPNYPPRELITTAKLIGGIIEQGLVEFIALGVALRYVMEALYKPPGSKMFTFGVVALDKFKGRLKEYPRYCQHLRAIDHFNDFPPSLQEFIKHGCQSQKPADIVGGQIMLPHMTSSPSTAGAIGQPSDVVGDMSHMLPGASQQPVPVVKPNPNANPTVQRPPGSGAPAKDTAEKIITPPEHIQDKISFIFNNLSQLNLSQKCEELKELMSEEFWLWVAQYLVMKRASIENNFHTLYSLFMDHLKLNTFSNMVIRETIRNIKVLLRADKGSANFSDKSLLKNLGHWLGMLTLGKNSPILHIDIDVKSLVIEAYSKGLQEMQYVVPFVAKVLECCSKSRVFKPPNPWTMHILNILAELHAEQDMKLHLKFEIEVLCNQLEINLKDLEPNGILKNMDIISKIKPQLSLPEGTKRSESTPLYPLLANTFAANPYTVQHDRRLAVHSSSAGATPTPPAGQAQVSTTPTPLQNLPQASVEPRFTYNEINLSLRGLEAYLTVGSIETLPGASQIKQIILKALELALQEIITAVMDRSIKVAINTTDHIIKKDFALDPDESRVRVACHHMVRNLSAAMAMISCREHLYTTVLKNLKQGLLPFLGRSNTLQQEQIEHISETLAENNVGICCAFVQKTAAEKAVVEIDKKLAGEYEQRKLARTEGKRYCDPNALTYQAERMPEQIRLKVGCVTTQQMAVYEEFSRNIPGFLPATSQDQLFLQKPVPLPNPGYSDYKDEIATFHMLTEQVTTELEIIIQTLGTLSPGCDLLPKLETLLEGMYLIRSSVDISTLLLLIRKIVENLLECIREVPPETELELTRVFVRIREVHIFILKAMADSRCFGPVWTAKHITKAWTECPEPFKYQLEPVDWLIRSNLMNTVMLDEYLARVIDDSRQHCYGVWLFIMQLIQVYLVGDSPGHLTESDLSQTLDSLVRVIGLRQVPDGLVQLLETLRIKNEVIASERSAESSGQSPNPSSLHFQSGVTQARDFGDPPGLQEKTEILFREWVQMYHSPNAGSGSTSAFNPFVKKMDVHGILKTDDHITRFFRICITICRDTCVRILEHEAVNVPTYARNKCFQTLDAFVRLISLLVKNSGESHNPTTKINLLNKVLGLICGIMINDIDSNGTDFYQLPYHRILIMLFVELNAPETILESINLPILMAFTQTLHLLRPSKSSGFTYAWLEMVSHRVFIGRMLAITPQQKGWSMYSMLLVDLFQFLNPFLRNAELPRPISVLYKGTLRVLLVLLHDFPEFLCEYHYTFCEVIPPNCIQMRNLILSAFPRNMRLPDPFTPNLKVDLLPEITVPPKVTAFLQTFKFPDEFKNKLDSYFKNRTPVTFLSELRTFLQVSCEPGLKYNMSNMNGLLLYTGIQAIAHMQVKGYAPSMVTIAHSSHMDIFQNLAVDLDSEGRYLFLNAIANQLRYPNSHTHYFSCTLLYLFVEANTEAIQEQITRVLLERLIVNRPHPWGLLITFVELIKNPTFKFWSHEFVKCAPEIKKLFESVASSCLGHNNNIDTSRFASI